VIQTWFLSLSWPYTALTHKFQGYVPQLWDQIGPAWSEWPLSQISGALAHTHFGWGAFAYVRFGWGTLAYACFGCALLAYTLGAVHLKFLESKLSPWYYTILFWSIQLSRTTHRGGLDIVLRSQVTAHWYKNHSHNARWHNMIDMPGFPKTWTRLQHALSAHWALSASGGNMTYSMIQSPAFWCQAEWLLEFVG